MAEIQIDINEVCEKLIDGETYRKIAEYYNITLSKLHRFLSIPEHSARAREALIISADSYADMAEQVLLDAKTNTQIYKARELSQFYKWKAATRYPKVYGNKQTEEPGNITVTIKDDGD